MIQEVQMSKEEKLALYMKLPKRQLAEMLYECNQAIQVKMNPGDELTVKQGGDEPVVITKSPVDHLMYKWKYCGAMNTDGDEKKISP
jgi:hypothetical protein